MKEALEHVVSVLFVSSFYFFPLESRISQNHRIVGIGRDFLRSCSPSPQLKQGQLEQVSQDHVQLNFEYLHRWRYSSMGSLFQCLPTFTVKKCFLVFRWNFMFFKLCPLPLVLSVDTTEKILAPSSSFPPSGIHTHWKDPLETSLLQTEQSQLSQPFLI